MARKYAIAGNCASASSTTLPIANIVGTAAVRTMLYDMTIGSDATPADQAAKYTWQRTTTVGTWAGAGGAAVTVVALDPGDPAAVTTSNQGICSAGPTITASTSMLAVALNQRATYRWVAAPGSEIKVPATASNGIALLPLVATATYNLAWTFLIEE